MIDLLALVYVGFGTLRGWKRGVAEELYRMVRTGLAFLAGLGVFGAVRTGLQSVTGLEGGFAGFLGFVGSYTGVFLLIRKFRSGIKAWLTAKFASVRSAYGALFGGVRTAVNSLVILLGAVLSNVETLNRWVTENSWVGSLLGRLIH